MALLPPINQLQQASKLHLLGLNLALAAGYFMLSAFGQQWSHFTSLVSLIWPGAGLMLFALLAIGVRALAGLWLGAFAANYFLHFASGSAATWPLLASAVIASGSCAQALLIARANPSLLRASRAPGCRGSLWFVASIFACTPIAATAGVAVLQQMHLLNFNEMLETWMVWWLGDAIGMLVITPLLGAWLIPQLRRNVAHLQVFLLLSLGLGLLLLLVSLIGYQERKATKASFHRDSQLLQQELAQELSKSRDSLQLLSPLLTASLKAEEFNQLASRFLADNPWIRFIAWSPDSQASQWLQQARPHLSSHFPLRQDRALIEQSLATGEPLAKAFDTNNAEPQLRVNWLLPVCNNQGCPTGLIAVQVDLGTWLEQGYKQVLEPNLEIALATAATAPEGLYWQRGRWHKYGPESTQQLNQDSQLNLADQLLVLHTRLDLRHWLLPSWLQLTTLTIGLLLLGLLAAYVRTRQKHQDSLVQNQERLEREVHDQTLALRTANDWLLKEIEQRQLTQEQLQASQASLQQRQQELRSLLDNIPDPIWLKNPQGKYIACNKAFTQLLGRSEAEVIGSEEKDLLSREVAKVFRSNDQLALSSDQPYRHEQWLTGADGQPHLLDTLKVAVRNDNQQTFGILGIGRDISDKHRLINELEKFKRFAENSSQGFAITTPRGETLYMNPVMRVMLNGYAQDGNFKKAFWHYYPDALQAQMREEIIPRTIEQGEWQGEMAALHADGTQFPTQETFFAIRDDRGYAQYLGIIMSDISAQKEAEAALSQAKEAAEEAARAKSRFLANMSHEIRTPLNAVLGYTQLLMRDPQLGEAQSERLELILNASQRLLGLINDVLDLSKIESGALNLRQDYFDLHREVVEIAKIVSGRAQSKGLALVTQIDLPNPSVVKGDRQKIGQILLNLLGNAIKFTSQGEVRLSLSRDGNWVEFTISDTGPGIAKQELKQLFSAFRQGQAGEDAGGTGLGLTLSRHLAEGMGGSLELSSQPGQGTLARLRLPLAPESVNLQATTIPKSLPQLKPGHSCRILVVEDDPASSDILVSLLRQLGCEVDTAGNGREGLNACEKSDYAMIFTDIRMPDLNGLELLKQLRKLPRYTQTPLVAVSASSLDHERNYYLAQGFQDFIGKPYSFDEIFAALDSYSGAQFEQMQEPTLVEIQHGEDANIDLTQIYPELRQLAQAAVSGNMSECRRIATNLGRAHLGQGRQLQLQAALKQYNLEQVEQLANSWLPPPTNP